VQFTSHRSNSFAMDSDDASFAAAIAMSIADVPATPPSAHVRLPEGCGSHTFAPLPFVASSGMRLNNANVRAVPADDIEALPVHDSIARAPVLAVPQHFAIKHICWGTSFCPILLQVINNLHFSVACFPEHFL
jgi:hypothetical protein